MNRCTPLLSLSIGILVFCQLSSFSSGEDLCQPASSFPLESYRAAALEKWSDAIAGLEAKDQTETHPEDSILFVGSSSIRMWKEIAADMAPYHPIQRGYGGAKWTDLAIFATRLITPHDYRAIVFFVANDITGGDDDRTPAEVAELFAFVHHIARKHSPDAPIFYIAVTPTGTRFSVWPQIQAGNNAVRQFCQNQSKTYFIGTESIYLNANGQPRLELFRKDQQHLNRAGYLRWSAAIKSHLDSVLHKISMSH